jgi:hypothetical protein
MSAPLPRIVDRNSPLRLARAAELAFPNGGMTASGLRKEVAKGRLTIYRVANKDFVTLAAIDDMLAACRVDEPKRLSTAIRPASSASQVALESLLLHVKQKTGAASRHNQAFILRRSGPQSVPGTQKSPG